MFQLVAVSVTELGTMLRSANCPFSSANVTMTSDAGCVSNDTSMLVPEEPSVMDTLVLDS
jgi:hypothetical protein